MLGGAVLIWLFLLMISVTMMMMMMMMMMMIILVVVTVIATNDNKSGNDILEHYATCPLNRHGRCVRIFSPGLITLVIKITWIILNRKYQCTMEFNEGIFKTCTHVHTHVYVCIYIYIYIVYIYIYYTYVGLIFT